MRTHRVKTFAHPPGFTLVEVMTVMVILGIAAAAIVPQIGTRDDLNVTAAARSVMTDLLYAQNRAIATQKKHVVIFTATGYTISARDSDSSPLYTITNPTTQNTYAVTLGSASTTFPQVAISSVNFDSSPTMAIEFDSLGAPSVFNVQQATATPMVNTGTVSLISKSGEFSAKVLIDPATGDASTQ